MSKLPPKEIPGSALSDEKWFATGFAFSDINGDGIEDFIACKHTSPPSVFAFLGEIDTSSSDVSSVRRIRPQALILRLHQALQANQIRLQQLEALILRLRQALQANQIRRLLRLLLLRLLLLRLLLLQLSRPLPPLILLMIALMHAPTNSRLVLHTREVMRFLSPLRARTTAKSTSAKPGH